MVHLDEGFKGTTNQIRDTIHKFFEISEQIATYGNFYHDFQDRK